MDETTGALKQAVQDYLEWMAVNGYAKSTQQDHQCTLRHFRLFIDINRYHWGDIFTRRTLDRFKKAKGKHHAHAVTGLSRYLYAQGKIARPIGVRKALPMLPVVYEDYTVTYEHLIFQCYSLAHKAMRRYLALPTDRSVFLNFYESANFRTVTDPATIEIYKVGVWNDYILTKDYIF